MWKRAGCLRMPAAGMTRRMNKHGTVAPLIGTEWWCHNCGRRVTACHCLEPEIVPFRLVRSRFTWVWRLLGLVAIVSALWWAGWLLPAMLTVAAAGAVLIFAFILLVCWVGFSEYRRDDVGHA